MTLDVFDHLKRHYAAVAGELRSSAQQAGLLSNPTGVGTQREEVYRTFLERYLPKTCDVFLGGYLFDLNGASSAQIDVVVTAGNTPRFRMRDGHRHIAPLEGSIAAAEIKTRLEKHSLKDALEGCASIPPMPDPKGIVSPYLRLHDDNWRDAPYKIVFAYDGISADAISHHITEFYNEHRDVPVGRRPNLIHVLGKYVIIRMVHGMTVINSDGQPDTNQPAPGHYHTFTTSPDVAAMGWMLNNIQRIVFLSNHLMFKYDEWHNRMMELLQCESVG